MEFFFDIFFLYGFFFHLGSRVTLLEPAGIVPHNIFPASSSSHSSNRFHRLRSQLRSLFLTNRTSTTGNNNNHDHNSIQTISVSNRYDHHNQFNPTQSVILNSQSYLNSDFIQTREPPPPYVEESSIPLYSTTTIHNHHNGNEGNDIESGNPNSTISTLYRIRKWQIPGSTLRDRMRQLISSSTSRTAIEDLNHSSQSTTTSLDLHFEEQPPIISIEDDEQPSGDDDKMLTP